jgi:histone-lysine N-methyltransferase MLL3
MYCISILHCLFTVNISFQGFSSDQTSKDDDSNVMAVICARTDRFTLSQDLCVSCGSLGSNDEGRLIVCSQCGQCYHPYCANVKLSKIILEKGWRCLDCTVCEGCGRPHDEARLILCDECDISYHIYCLDPPLEAVPRGTWKCKWLVTLIQSKESTKIHGYLRAFTNCSPL